MASISNNEPGNIAEMTPVTNKRRRKKSMVWEHFTVETVGSGCTRACCKQCKQTFAYSTGSKLAGTSHLKRHIAMGSCPKIKNQDKKQITSYTPASSKTCMSGSTSNTPAKRRYRGGYSVLNMLFDQDRSILDLARMLIIQEYPLHMVEQSAFITFVQNLQPRFRIPTFPEIEMECIAIYEKEKEQLMQLLGALPGRIGLTLSLWTSRQTLGYMCLTGHFIDDDWKVHRRILNFMNVSSPHTEMALSDAIGACLSDWNMKTRLFTVTIDNSRSSHDLYSANLRDHLSCNSSLMLGGRLFFVRCYAHILSTVAQEALEAIHDVIYNVRESIKYIKSSPSREEKFCEIAEQFQIMNAKTLLSLDVQNHWNTTYLMLVGALELKHAFASLELSEAYYNEAPSMDDWKRVEIVCTHLRHLHDSAKLISSTANPTANIYFHEAWKIHFELSNAAAAEENLASGILGRMHERFDKYWKDCSLALAIAVVMDPRFKMKLVEFSFSKIYGVDAASYIKYVNDGIHELYQEYIVQPLPLTPAYFELSPALPVVPSLQPSEISTVLATTENHQENPEDKNMMILDNNDTDGNNKPNNGDNTNNGGTFKDGGNTNNDGICNNGYNNNNDGTCNNGNNGIYEFTVTESAVTEASVTGETAVNGEAGTTEELTASEVTVTEADSTTEVAVMESGITSEAAVMEAGSSAEVAVTEGCVPEEMVVEAAATTEAALAFPKLEPTPHALSTPPPAPPSLQLLTSSDGIMDIFEIYVSETTLTQQTKSELDQYLEEALVPRIQDFEVLDWWKLNQLKYPTLCKMARDVLAIPFSTVTSGSMFATGNRVLDEYRSSLKPETVEALFCARDWLEHAPVSQGNVAEPSNALIKMEMEM